MPGGEENSVLMMMLTEHIAQLEADCMQAPSEWVGRLVGALKAAKIARDLLRQSVQTYNEYRTDRWERDSQEGYRRG